MVNILQKYFKVKIKPNYSMKSTLLTAKNLIILHLEDSFVLPAKLSNMTTPSVCLLRYKQAINKFAEEIVGETCVLMQIV